MQDIKVVQNGYGSWDISIDEDSNDIESEDGMDSAIWVSLLTDQRAPAELVIKPEDRRGWPGDLVSIVEERKIGSLLWLVDQRRLTTTTLNECIFYARNALQWMITDNICKDIQVSGEIVPTQGIRLTINIFSFDGSSSNRFVDLWKLTGN